MIEIEVCDMRAAGKPGYVAKITGEHNEKNFLNAASYSGHGASAKTISYEIKEDGIYEICDANFGGRKRRIEFVLIENGEIVKSADSLSELKPKPQAPTVQASYPGLKQESKEPNGSLYFSKGGNFVLKFEYDPEKIARLKSEIPSKARQWEGLGRIWMISEDYGLTALAMARDWDLEVKPSAQKKLGL